MNKQVLIVEDHDDIRMMMSIMLRQFGYDVLEARDGYEALETAIAERPDIVLMDIALPVLDGLGAAKAIRQHAQISNVPIIALTAYGDFYSERAIEAGCNKVVCKPVQFELLRTVIEEYTENGTTAVAAGPPGII